MVRSRCRTQLSIRRVTQVAPQPGSTGSMFGNQRSLQSIPFAVQPADFACNFKTVSGCSWHERQTPQEICQSGAEGGGPKPIGLPYPIPAALCATGSASVLRTDGICSIIGPTRRGSSTARHISTGTASGTQFQSSFNSATPPNHCNTNEMSSHVLK